MVGRVGAQEVLNAPVLLVEADPTWPATAARLVAGRPRRAGRPGAAGRARGVDLGARTRGQAGDRPGPRRRRPGRRGVVRRCADRGAATRCGSASRTGTSTGCCGWPSPRVNLHVFALGSVEIDRMLVFRDHLRTDPDDRALYERTKRGLARRTWEVVQQYADAKGPVVEDIVARAARRTAHARGRGARPGRARTTPGPLPWPTCSGYPCSMSARCGRAGVDPDVAPGALGSVAAGCPASVLVGDVRADGLAGTGDAGERPPAARGGRARAGGPPAGALADRGRAGSRSRWMATRTDGGTATRTTTQGSGSPSGTRAATARVATMAAATSGPRWPGSPPRAGRAAARPSTRYSATGRTTAIATSWSDASTWWLDRLDRDLEARAERRQRGEDA